MPTSSIPQLIESCGFCRADEVEELQTMKTGMTNRSYAFFVKGNRYIIRIPGEGTDRLINRAQEHAVYSAIEPLGISELVPLAIVLTVCALFMIFPEGSKLVLSVVRGFLGDDLGLYYALLGVGIVGCTLYIAFSKFGKIKLGDCEKPQYRSFQWGTMIFTSTMAADILFYSLCEWALYANESQVKMMGGMQKWASTYPLFHWGPIAWGFYIVLAVAFGFMIHIRGRDKQKFSEACRPLLGSRVDGVLGRVIDLTAIFALIAGTATTFSLATPLLSRAISRVFGLQDSIGLTIAILLMIAAVYTFTVWFGMKGIAKLAAICSYCFFALLAYVLFGGGETRYILETGFSAIGNLAQNFIGLATWMDPLRETSFPQNWTIYYWAYWMVWCVATPFFYRRDQQGSYYSQYDPRRLRLGPCGHLYLVYHPWQLRPCTAAQAWP